MLQTNLDALLFCSNYVVSYYVQFSEYGPCCIDLGVKFWCVCSPCMSTNVSTCDTPGSFSSSSLSKLPCQQKAVNGRHRNKSQSVKCCFCGRFPKILASRSGQGCQIFLSTTYPNLPNEHTLYQMAMKHTEWLKNIPNGHKLYQHCLF
jgi:hypothetical protein